MSRLKEIVDKRLAELNLGPIEAANAGGIERTFVRDIVQGKKQTVRSDKILGLARALKMEPSELSRLLGSLGPSKSARSVTVAAHVQAGRFVEAWEWPDGDQYQIGIQSEAHLSQFKLYAAETRGPSMNDRWPEGTVVVFTDLEETLESPIVGKAYVVERRRASGEIEHTVKILHKAADESYWLVPQSKDPLFQEAFPMNGGMANGDEVRLRGRVWYAVTRE